MNSYTKNLETGKLELRFEKAAYMALPDATKKKIRSTCLWSSQREAWVSRAKEPNLHWAVQLAKELNLTNEGETGERLSFSDQVENEQERAAARVERMETRAENAEKESTARYEAAKQIGSFIPMGQPILVGHHSEGRHRRDLEKIDNNMRKSVEAADKAKYYEDRAEIAEYTANGEKFKNVNYLLNRIAECDKHLRALERSLKGTDVINRETGERYVNGYEISDARREHVTGRIAIWTEKKDFFMVKLQEIGGGQLTAERLKAERPKYVKVGGKWWPLKSINRDTVTVLNWLDIATWTWKFKFDKIQALESGHITVVYDRDANEVKPTIKFK